MSMQREIRFESRDGIALYCRDYPPSRNAPGLPVLCMPGITRNSRDFEELAPQLAARHRVLCPDFRGRGHSAHDPDWRNYQPSTYVEDMFELLDEAGVQRAALIGTSLGGLVAMLMAAAQRERVAGIVFNDIGPEVGAAGLARIKEYIGRLPPVANWEEAVAQARTVYGFAWPGLDDAAWSRLVRRGYREDESGVPVLDLDPGIGEAVRAQGATAGDAWPLFGSLAALPMLVIHGASSDILTDDIVTRMRATAPGLAYACVPNRGHVPLMDEPEALTAIETFLKDLE